MTMINTEMHVKLAMTEASVLNACGVSYLANATNVSDLKKSFDNFKAALGIIARISESLGPEGAYGGPTPTVKIHVASRTHDTHDAGVSSSLSISRRLVDFSLNQERPGSISFETLTLCSAIIMYNYALGLQLKGSFQKASMLYEHAMKLLGPISSALDCTMIISLLMDNLFHVYYRLGDFRSAKTVSEQRLLAETRYLMSKEEYHNKSRKFVAPSA